MIYEFYSTTLRATYLVGANNEEDATEIALKHHASFRIVDTTPLDSFTYIEYHEN